MGYQVTQCLGFELGAWGERSHQALTLRLDVGGTVKLLCGPGSRGGDKGGGIGGGVILSHQKLPTTTKRSLGSNRAPKQQPRDSFPLGQAPRSDLEKEILEGWDFRVPWALRILVPSQ